MGYIRKGVLGYVVLSLFLINQVSAKQVKPKKLKARATTTATRTRSTATTTTPATAPQIPPTEVKKNSASPVTEPYKKVSSAPLSERNTAGSSSRFNVFQVGAGAMFDSDGGNSGALSLTYNPTYSLASSLSLKGYLGGILSNVFAGSLFAMGDLGLTLKYDFSSSLSIEGGGGMQYWSGTMLRNVHPQIKAALGFDIFQITYASVFDSLATTHQILGALSFKI